MRVVVAGGGVGGLTAAAALHRDGHDVTVCEARNDTAVGAGISLWPNALAALDRIDAGDRVRAAGGSVAAGAVRWCDGRWIRRPDPGRLVDALGEPLVVVERAALRDALTALLPAGTVRFATRVEDVETRGGRTVVAVVDGTGQRELTADLVIAADGTRSRFARRLNGPLPHTYAGYTAWRGVADRGFDDRVAGEMLGPGSQCGMVPIGEGRAYWFATKRLPEAADVGDQLGYVRELVADWASPLPELVAATRSADLLRNDLYDRPTARRWTTESLALVGDAAHPMRPHLGQGGCQAVEDAVTLAACVRSAGGPGGLAAALTRYQRLRRRRVTRIVRESKAIGLAVNRIPAAVLGPVMRASVVAPDAVVRRHLAGIASRRAFEASMSACDRPPDR